jgi:hypothetical protein
LALAVVAGLALAARSAESPKARWIWYPGEQNQANSTVYARWSFRLPAKPKAAVIRITCDNKFALFVNGTRAGEFQGEEIAWNRLFEYRVTKRLDPGLNVIAAQGLNVEGPAGLLVEGEITLPGRQMIPIASGADWKVTNREQPGWQKAEFDDSAWAAPVLLGSPPVAPWGTPGGQRYPLLPMVSRPQWALKVTETSAIGVSNAKLIIAPDGRAAVLDASEKEPAFVVLDFGRESVGILQMQFLPGSQGTCELACGESLQEATRGPLQQPFEVEAKGLKRWSAPDRRAFRYLKVTALPGSHLLVDAAWLEAQGYPVKDRGYFECSDPLMNQIWQVSRHTLRLCMQHFYEDGIKRDRALWMGDTRVEALVNYYVFGDTRLIADSLEQLAAIQREDGAIPAVGPQPNTLLLPDYCAYWISGLWDYYAYSGDLKAVKKMWPNLLRQVEWFQKQQDEHRLLPNAERKEWWTFIDWADLDKRGEVAALNCVWHQALDEAARLARAVGERPKEREFAQMAARVKQAINERLWSKERGAYVDCRVGDELSQKLSEQANMLAVYTGVADRDKWESIHRYLFESGQPVVRTTTPYLNFYVVSALLKMGCRDQAVKLIRGYWGEMIRRGATSFWETFDPASPPGSTPPANMSYCHGWSSGPGRLLPQALLVGWPSHPNDSGMPDFVEPQLGSLAWARAIIPTRWGDMRVACWNRSGLYRVEVTTPTLPMGFRLPVRVPAPTGTSVYLDSKRVRTPERVGDLAQVRVGPGEHMVEVRK